jgi:hypothetical protein
VNYLSPAVGNGPWTPEEEQLLFLKYNEIGPLWRRIALFFTGRTDINVKSRWNLIQRRMKRQANKRTHPTLSRTNTGDACQGVESQPPLLEDPWESFIMNDKGSFEEEFDLWVGANPY